MSGGGLRVGCLGRAVAAAGPRGHASATRQCRRVTTPPRSRMRHYARARAASPPAERARYMSIHAWSARTSATSPSSPTSTTARPPSSTPCCGRRASSAPTSSRRAGHGLDRPRAREGHHDPREEHVRPLPGREDQHRGHARPRRLRRRGRAHADPGRRRAPPRGRRRGAPAADALRAQEGARGRAHAVVVINKIDREDARPDEVLDEVYDLFIDLDATEEQLDFPVLYTNARTGIANRALEDAEAEPGAAVRGDPRHDPAARVDPATASSSGRPPRLRRLRRPARDRPHRQRPDPARPTAWPWSAATARSSPPRSRSLYGFEGLKRVEVAEAGPGDIVAVAGIEQRSRSATPSPTPRSRWPCPLIRIDEPTMSMMFSANVSPFAGREGKFVTSRKLRERLWRERRERRHPRRGDRLAGHVQGLRPRRAPARDPHRDDAARGLRDGGRQARDHHARGSTARHSSRWSTSSSTSRGVHRRVTQSSARARAG